MIPQQTALQVQAQLDAGVPLVFLDVRQPEEYAIGHIAGCKLIPLGELPSRLGELEVAPDEPIVVYCHHGVRSLRAVNYLMQMGFTNVVSLAGGIEAWSLQVDPSIKRY
jgi:rhodanese-related sulfurtransferase